MIPVSYIPPISDPKFQTLIPYLDGSEGSYVIIHGASLVADEEEKEEDGKDHYFAKL